MGEQIQIMPDEKTKLQETERSDCLFCASGYEIERPYPIEVKGTIAQKRAHKPHGDFWHYGCILQYVEYGNKKCPYCTYELCLNNPHFAINSFMPAARTFPETRVQFENVNRFISVRTTQNRRSRYPAMLAALGIRFKECLAHTKYNILECRDYTVQILELIVGFVIILIKILYEIIMFIPRGIMGFVVDDELDIVACCKCWCSWILIFVILVIAVSS